MADAMSGLAKAGVHRRSEESSDRTFRPGGAKAAFAGGGRMLVKKENYCAATARGMPLPSRGKPSINISVSVVATKSGSSLSSQ